MMKNVYSLLGGCTIVYMEKRGFRKNRSKTVNKHHVSAEAPEDS